MFILSQSKERVYKNLSALKENEFFVVFSSSCKIEFIKICDLQCMPPGLSNSPSTRAYSQAYLGLAQVIYISRPSREEEKNYILEEFSARARPSQILTEKMSAKYDFLCFRTFSAICFIKNYKHFHNFRNGGGGGVYKALPPPPYF